MQRKQKPKIKRREKVINPACNFPGRGSAGNAKTAVDGIECRLARSGGHPSANQQQTELITALLAEIREAGSGFSHQDDSAFRRGAGKCGTGLSPVPGAAAGSAIPLRPRSTFVDADERNELKRLWRPGQPPCRGCDKPMVKEEARR